MKIIFHYIMKYYIPPAMSNVYDDHNLLFEWNFRPIRKRDFCFVIEHMLQLQFSTVISNVIRSMRKKKKDLRSYSYYPLFLGKYDVSNWKFLEVWCTWNRFSVLTELFLETWHWKTQVKSTCPRSVQGHSNNLNIIHRHL